MAELIDFIRQQEQMLARLSLDAAWSEESLHDYRVCLRRLQVTLPWLDLLLPESATLRDRISRQLKYSNRARNRAVLLEQLQQRCAPADLVARISARSAGGNPVSASKLKGLVEAVALGCRRWEQFTSSGSVAWLPSAACWPMLRLQHALYMHRVVQRAAKINTPQKAMQGRRWHRLRVAIKRLRYLVEWLVTQDPRWLDQLRMLKSWQEQLGNLSDLAMVEQWLKRRHNVQCKGVKSLLRQLNSELQAKQTEAFVRLPSFSQYLCQVQTECEARWARS